MYKILKCVLEEKRRGTCAESQVTVGGMVSEATQKKAIAEKLAPALNDLDAGEMFDKETGKIRIKPAPKPPKTLTAEEKMVADFKKLQSRPFSQYHVSIGFETSH